MLKICGNVIVSASGTCRTSGIVFIGWPGNIYIDNLSIECGTTTALYLNFEDEWEYVNHKSDDFTPVRTAVPAGSYYDEVETVADSVYYTFENEEACYALSVQSEVETYINGDINADGTISVKDSRILAKIILGSLDPEDYLMADMTGDGEVTVKDVRYLKKLMLGTVDYEYVTEGMSAVGAAFNAMAQGAELSCFRLLPKDLMLL